MDLVKSGFYDNMEDGTMGNQGRHNVKKPKLSEAQKTEKSGKKGENKK
jgi:hypothetical protein